MTEISETPWKAICCGPVDWAVYSNDGYWVAAIHKNASTYEDPVEANARLIAAAPRLLAALVELRKWQAPSGQDPEIDAALQEADAAIREAKGE